MKYVVLEYVCMCVPCITLFFLCLRPVFDQTESSQNVNESSYNEPSCNEPSWLDIQA